MTEVNTILDWHMVAIYSFFELFNLPINLNINFLIKAEQLGTLVYAYTGLVLSNFNIPKNIFNTL